MFQSSNIQQQQNFLNMDVDRIKRVMPLLLNEQQLPQEWCQDESQSSLLNMKKAEVPDFACVYDQQILEQNFKLVHDAFPEHFHHFFSMKVAPFPRLLRIATENGLGLECSSAGELEIALQCLRKSSDDKNVVNPALEGDERISDVSLAGGCKADYDIEAALLKGVTLFANNLQEVERIAKVVDRLGLWQGDQQQQQGQQQQLPSSSSSFQQQQPSEFPQQQQQQQQQQSYSTPSEFPSQQQQQQSRQQHPISGQQLHQSALVPPERGGLGQNTEPYREYASHHEMKYPQDPQASSMANRVGGLGLFHPETAEWDRDIRGGQSSQPLSQAQGQQGQGQQQQPSSSWSRHRERYHAHVSSTSSRQSLKVGLRVNPLVGDMEQFSQFGEPLLINDGENKIIQAFRTYPWLRGLHVHIGKGVSDMHSSQGVTGLSQQGQQGHISHDDICQGIAKVAQLADRIDSELCGGGQGQGQMMQQQQQQQQCRVEIINIGGGITNDGVEHTNESVFVRFRNVLERCCPSLFDTNKERCIITEMGRAYCQGAGIIVARVEDVLSVPLSSSSQRLLTPSSQTAFVSSSDSDTSSSSSRNVTSTSRNIGSSDTSGSSSGTSGSGMYDANRNVQEPTGSIDRDRVDLSQLGGGSGTLGTGLDLPATTTTTTTTAGAQPTTTTTTTTPLQPSTLSSQQDRDVIPSSSLGIGSTDMSSNQPPQSSDIPSYPSSSMQQTDIEERQRQQSRQSQQTWTQQQQQQQQQGGGGNDFIRVCTSHAGTAIFSPASYDHSGKFIHDILVFDNNGQFISKHDIVDVNNLPSSSSSSSTSSSSLFGQQQQPQQQQQFVKHILCGPLAWSQDRIHIDNLVFNPPIERGNFLVFTDAGANTLAMMSRNCSRLTPPVFAFVNDSNLVCWKARETLAQVGAYWGFESDWRKIKWNEGSIFAPSGQQGISQPSGQMMQKPSMPSGGVSAPLPENLSLSGTSTMHQSGMGDVGEEPKNIKYHWVRGGEPSQQQQPQQQQQQQQPSSDMGEAPPEPRWEDLDDQKARHGRLENDMIKRHEIEYRDLRLKHLHDMAALSQHHRDEEADRVKLWEKITEEGGEFPSDKMPPLEQRYNHAKKERHQHDQQVQELEALKQRHQKEFEDFKRHHREEEAAHKRELQDMQRARDQWFKDRDAKQALREKERQFQPQQPITSSDLQQATQGDKLLGPLRPDHYPTCGTKARPEDWSIFPEPSQARRQQQVPQQVLQQPYQQQVPYQQQQQPIMQRQQPILQQQQPVRQQQPLQQQPVQQPILSRVSAADSDKQPYMSLPTTSPATTSQPIIYKFDTGSGEKVLPPYRPSTTVPLTAPSSSMMQPTSTSGMPLQQQQPSSTPSQGLQTKSSNLALEGGDAAIAPVFTPGTTHDPNIVPPPTFKETVTERSKGLMKDTKEAFKF